MTEKVSSLLSLYRNLRLYSSQCVRTVKALLREAGRVRRASPQEDSAFPKALYAELLLYISYERY